MSSPAGTPRRSRRILSEDESSRESTPRSSRRGANGTASRQDDPSTPSTPRSGRKRPAGQTETPRSSKAKASASQRSSVASSPASQVSQRSRRTDVSSPGQLPPIPTSPPSVGSRIHDTSLYSSPGLSSRAGLSENIDLTSPLYYGTPSSRLSGTPGRSVHGTPVVPRPDIRSDKRMRHVRLDSDQAGGTDGTDPVTGAISEPASQPTLVIWGTDIVVTEAKEKFKNFVQCFIDPTIQPEEGVSPNEPLYLQKIDEIHQLEEPFVNLNCSHLQEFDSDLYRQLICYPQEVIPTFDMATNELYFERFPEDQLEHQIQVRPFNTDKTKNMRSLNPEDIDQLITVSGMVIRTSQLIPEMQEAFFRCHICAYTKTVELDRGRIAEPAVCDNCRVLHSMALIHNRSNFTDKQMIKMQETPDDMPAGQTPHTVMLYAHNDLVDSVQPGDRISVTGIYRATPLRVNPRQRNIKSVYKTYIDVIHFHKAHSDRLHEITDSEGGPKLSQERIEYLKELSQSHDIYLKLSRALAPSIYENEDIKKGILCQLFGGTKKDFSNTGRGHFRSDINILLCGDPGTSKSQLLRYVHNLLPRGQYTSGTGSSAVGLTAYITKDPESKQLVLQTGALVLSDNGVCCIDEFDKMNDSARAILHEVMEQQTLSIAKAGIICSLNARASVLAAANPVDSQWNPKKTIIENIQLPHTLLSRFDLIFLMLDPQDELYDRRLANHLVSLYHRTEAEAEEEFMDMSILKDYIAYAKTHIQPRLSEEACQFLVQSYVKMRKEGSSRGMVSAYPRQLESLIRLAEAHARMRYSQEVEDVDVIEAKRLYEEALKQSAVDPKDGTINIDILATGISNTARKQRREVADALRKLLLTKTKQPRHQGHKVFEELRSQSEVSFSKDIFDEAVRLLEDEEFCIYAGGYIRLCAPA